MMNKNKLPDPSEIPTYGQVFIEASRKRVESMFGECGHEGEGHEEHVYPNYLFTNDEKRSILQKAPPNVFNEEYMKRIVWEFMSDTLNKVAELGIPWFSPIFEDLYRVVCGIGLKGYVMGAVDAQGGETVAYSQEEIDGFLKQSEELINQVMAEAEEDGDADLSG